MASASLLLIGLVFALVGINRYLKRKRLPPGAKPLPGPRSLPLIGRVHDIPKDSSWLKFYEWSRTYGPIYQMEIFGTVHVWISSEKIANDLLSKRAAVYSDRPQIPNLPDNRTSGEYLALLGRTETWKRQRRLCSNLMHASTLRSLHGYPTRERDRFLYLLARDPANYVEWIEQFTSRTVSRLSWGTAKPAQVLRHTTFGLLETISPAGALPNLVSALRHLPRWASPWKSREGRRHELEDRLFRANVEFARRGVEDGNGEEGFITTFLRESGRREGAGSKWGIEGTEEAMHVVGLMAIAGTLTIGSPIQSYILAMCHYPDVQKELQREIDEVCEGRCPGWEDRERLPMLRAVVKEVVRWRPPVPTGIPHATEEDDVYEGYFIPKGATIHALEWGITRNEEMYPNPEEFMPSRWLDPKFPTYREPLTQYPNLSGFSQFGFGRRTCQGVPIVEQDLFLAIGGMAWALNIQKKRDPVTGAEIPVHWDDYTSLLIAKPCRFEFDAVPRDQWRLEEMRRMFDSARDAERDQNEAREMDISQFEEDLGPEKIYRDQACEVERIKEDARRQQEQEHCQQREEQSEETGSAGSGGYSSSGPGLEFRDSSSEAETEYEDEDATLVDIDSVDGSLMDGKGEGGMKPVVVELDIPGAWCWSE